MPTIKPKVDTVLKQADRRVSFTVKDGSIGGTILPSTGQELLIKLAGNHSGRGLKAGETWTLYQPHWEIPGGFLSKGSSIAPTSIRLKAPYFAQNDTRSDGWRYCFSHACSVAAFYLKPSLFDDAARNGYSQPEQYYISKLSGDTTEPFSQIDALKAIGIDAYYTQSLSPKDLYQLLELGIPTPIGVAYKSSGHWVCCVGREGDNWLVHDSYGVRSGTQNFYAVNSTDQDKLGAFDKYSQSSMDAIFWDLAPDDRKESGWSIVITAVDGKRTNAPKGL